MKFNNLVVNSNSNHTDKFKYLEQVSITIKNLKTNSYNNKKNLVTKCKINPQA